MNKKENFDLCSVDCKPTKIDRLLSPFILLILLPQALIQPKSDILIMFSANYQIMVKGKMDSMIEYYYRLLIIDSRKKKFYKKKGIKYESFF